jgi:hypothetical protein
MMRIVGIVVVALIDLLTACLAILHATSGSAEVVTPRARDAGGTLHSTRRWGVADGTGWVRAGHPEKG